MALLSGKTREVGCTALGESLKELTELAPTLVVHKDSKGCISLLEGDDYAKQLFRNIRRLAAQYLFGKTGVLSTRGKKALEKYYKFPVVCVEMATDGSEEWLTSGIQCEFGIIVFE